MNPKTITILVLFIFAGVVFVVFGLPQIRSIQDIRSDVIEKKRDFTAMQEKFESTKGVIAQFQSIEEKDRALVLSALPKDLDLPNLLVRLERLISSSGLVSEAIEVRESVINVTVLGNYESLKVFLKELERSLRIFDVEDVSFAAPELTKEGAGDFRFLLRIKTYYQ